MRSLRLLILASTFPRWQGDSQSGFVLEQSRWFQSHSNTTVKVLAPHDYGAETDELLSDVHVQRYRYFYPSKLQKLVYPAILPNIRKSRWLLVQLPFLLISMAMRLSREIINYKPDILYAHWALPQGLIVALIARLTHIPAMLTCHSSDLPILTKLPLVGKTIARSVLLSFAHITCVNRDIYELALSLVPERVNSIHLIPMGYNPEILEIDRNTQNLTENKLLFLGRLTQKKGLQQLIKVLASSREIPFHLEVVGDGEERTSLERLIEEELLSQQIVFSGFLSGEDKLHALTRSTIFILPSVISTDGDVEGLPVALLEAMAAGLVCIASKSSNASEIIQDSENGFLFDYKKPEEFALVLKKVLEMPEQERKRIATNARRSVEQYAWNNLALRYIEFLKMI